MLGLPGNGVEFLITYQDGTIRHDTYNILISSIIILIAQLIQQQSSITVRTIRGEIFQIVQVNQIGQSSMLVSTDWQITVTAWEQFNLSQYQQISMKNGGHLERNSIWAPHRPFHKGSEGALSAGARYLLQSAQATSFLLLSVSAQYGKTGLTTYDGLNMISSISFQEEHRSSLSQPEAAITASFLFKLGCAPLHFWAPDLYDGLPTYISLWMMTIPKMAVLFTISQLSLMNLSAGWTLFVIFGFVSLLVGSLGLGSQWKIKRFLAYSSISNQGFILLAFGSSPAYYFYIIVYIISTLVQFVSLLAGVTNRGTTQFDGSVTLIKEWAGMFRQNPGLAIAMSLCLFSLAGCPPLIGFYTKLLVLKNVMELGNYSLAVTVIIASVISTCNYLALIRVINQDPARSVIGKEIHAITYSPAQQIAYQVGMVLTMLMFISSGPQAIPSLQKSVVS